MANIVLFVFYVSFSVEDDVEVVNCVLVEFNDRKFHSIFVR
jgi:hypothetical protein